MLWSAQNSEAGIIAPRVRKAPNPDLNQCNSKPARARKLSSENDVLRTILLAQHTDPARLELSAGTESGD